MSVRHLDCVGIDTDRDRVGKHSFVPITESIIHAPGKIPTDERYVSEKIAELALTQQELRRVVRERDALAEALADLLNRTKNFGHSGFPSMAHFKAFADAHIDATETIAKLANGELRKVGA